MNEDIENDELFCVVFNQAQIETACKEYAEKRLYVQPKQLWTESGATEGVWYVNVFVANNAGKAA